MNAVQDALRSINVSTVIQSKINHQTQCILVKCHRRYLRICMSRENFDNVNLLTQDASIVFIRRHYQVTSNLGQTRQTKDGYLEKWELGNGSGEWVIFFHFVFSGLVRISSY